MLLLHLIQASSTVAHTLHLSHVLTHAFDGGGNGPVAPTPPTDPKAGDQAFSDVYNFVNAIKGLITALGFVVFFIGVTVAGMMKVMSFGNERQDAIAKAALTSAVIGLIIMLGSGVLYNLINGAFNINK